MERSALYLDLNARIEYYANEFDVSCSEVIAVLEVLKQQIITEMLDMEVFDDDP